MADKEASAVANGAKSIATNLGNIYNLQERTGTFDEVAIELCAYFVMLTFCMLYLLDQVRGKPAKLENWLYFRKLSIYKEGDRNSKKVAQYLHYALIYFMAMPVVSLLGWSILIIYSNAQDEISILSGICVLILGSAFILFGYNVMKVKWTNYRFKMQNLVITTVVFLLILIYQVIVVFGYAENSPDKFLPYSAIFLNLNVTILAVVIFVSKYKDQKGINQIVKKFFPVRDIVIDRNRTIDLNEEIPAQLKDPTWYQSFEDLTDIITISRVSDKKYGQLIGGGFLQQFNEMKAGAQKGFQFAMWFLSFLVLIGYAVLLYF
jgi:hypothetical protein